MKVTVLLKTKCGATQSKRVSVTGNGGPPKKIYITLTPDHENITLDPNEFESKAVMKCRVFERIYYDPDCYRFPIYMEDHDE